MHPSRPGADVKNAPFIGIFKISDLQQSIGRHIKTPSKKDVLPIKNFLIGW